MPISKVKMHEEVYPRRLTAVISSNRKRSFWSYHPIPISPCADLGHHCRVKGRIRIQFAEITDSSTQPFCLTGADAKHSSLVSVALFCVRFALDRD
jgi:hypothetical protein